MGEAKNIYFTCLKGNFQKIFKGLERVYKSCASKKKSENADLRENVDGEDHHPRGRTLRFHKLPQAQLRTHQQSPPQEEAQVKQRPNPGATIHWTWTVEKFSTHLRTFS